MPIYIHLQGRSHVLLHLPFLTSRSIKHRPDGTAAYVEFPDTFVQRGLAYEGLGDWEQAVSDYTKAIELWGGGRGPDTNPFALTFRGNSLARLGRYEEAVKDYKASADLFLLTRDEGDALYARANQALALYETGARDEAVKVSPLLFVSGGVDLCHHDDNLTPPIPTHTYLHR